MRPLATSSRRMSVVLPVLVLFACGGTSPQRASEEPSELVVTKPNGTTLRLTPSAAECGASDYAPDVQVVRVHDFSDDHNLVVEVVPSDVTGGKTFDLPVNAGDMQTGPANAFVFFGSKDFEVSTVQEGSAGSLDVSRASCDPVALELSIDATLDSEYFDGDSLKVKGHIDLVG